jgi:GntR family transcriptional regulator
LPGFRVLSAGGVRRGGVRPGRSSADGGIEELPLFREVSRSSRSTLAARSATCPASRAFSAASASITRACAAITASRAASSGIGTGHHDQSNLAAIKPARRPALQRQPPADGTPYTQGRLPDPSRSLADRPHLTCTRPDVAHHPGTGRSLTCRRPRGVTARPRTGYDANVPSTNPTLGIDHSSAVPLHEQVAAAIRRAIADGEVGPGERLPPARDLAAVLGVNANTVFRALRTLREEGLVEFRRGRGVSVTGIAPRRSPVVAKARELVAVARRYGFGPDELAEIIEQVSVELP